MNKKIVTLYFLLHSALYAILFINSIFIVEWLNRSLFIDYAINPEVASGYYFGEILLVFLIALFLYAVIGTFVVSLLTTNLIFAGLIIANHIKVLEKNEFITFTELKAIVSPKELLSFINVEFGLVLLGVIGVIALLVILQYLTIKVSKKLNVRFNKRARLIFAIIPLIILSFIFFKPNLYNEYVLKFEKPDAHEWNPVKRAQSTGYIPTLLHTIKPNYQDKPVNYSKKHANSIKKKYQAAATDINQDRTKSLADSQTIIYLSETLMDPEELPGLLKNETPIPTIKQYIRENIGGTMYSPFIGGGTANIEWSVLTSFSLEVFNEPITTTPYSDFYVDAKNHQTILNYFNQQKKAIHPYTPHLYKREKIYEKIKFDEFIYLENGIQHTDKIGESEFVSDKALNKDILRESKKADTDLLHVLTMQNHVPFKGDYQTEKYVPQISEKYPDDKKGDLYNYLQGLKETDEAVGELIGELNKSEREINYLFFGDHFPNLFTGLEDQFTKEKLHETPWFIYMNGGRSSKEIRYDNLSPMFFIPLLLKEGDYYVSSYHALLDELLDADIKRVGNDFVYTSEGEIAIKDLSKDIQGKVNDYQFIMYDALFGENWLKNEFYTPIVND